MQEVQFRYVPQMHSSFLSDRVTTHWQLEQQVAWLSIQRCAGLQLRISNF